MSTKIGIISEGVSDYCALQHIVGRYLKDYDVYTIPLKPKIKQSGKQDGFGTWQGVFQYISGEDDEKLIVEALKEDCRFVIIQIDTDVCDKYGVEKVSDHCLLHSNVKNKLSSSIHVDFDQSAAIYAICIHELECWLLPFVCEAKLCAITDNCLKTLNKAIRTKGTIDRDNKNCDPARKLYQHIFGNKRKPLELKQCSEFNFGFKSFIEQLDVVKATLEQEKST